MEGKEEIGSRVSVEAPQGFCLSARPENPSQPGAPTMVAGGTPPVVSMGGTHSSDGRKKRGRPRKYGPDGTPSAALSPMPISASIPLSGGEFSGWKQPKVRSFQTVKKAPKVEYENLGDKLAYLVGGNFTPHVITVNAGEDVAMKILSFSQQESRAICVLSASGSISNVTLRQPNSSGGTLTYEGRFEILSLTGSFMPTDNGIVKSRSGGMSVSLAGPDGRVLGGGLAGLLVAASPVQVVLGSFLPGHHQEHKPKRQRIDHTTPVMPAVVTPAPAPTPIPTPMPVPVSAPVPAQVPAQAQTHIHIPAQAQIPAHTQAQTQTQAQAHTQAHEGGYGVHKVNFTSPPPSFHHTTNNLPCMNSTQQDSRDFEHDHNLSSPDGDSEEDDDDDLDDDDDDDDDMDSPSNLEISG